MVQRPRIGQAPVPTTTSREIMSATTEELDLTITQKTLRMPTGTMQFVGLGAVGHPLR